jgi:Mn2+/Fe2+ NRAMP family transporter
VSLSARIGPGLVIAATGLGAGDLIAASVSGARFGYALLWAALLGAVLKFVLNEGLARWQLVTGLTLLEGWRQHLPPFISWYFIVYLIIWTFVVAGALMAACGLAVHALFPAIDVATAGIVQSIIATVFVLTGRYRLLEPVMKLFIVLMFAVVLYCAALLFPGWGVLLTSIATPSVPEGSMWFLFGVVGGVGGSVTLLSYGYWIREKGWKGRECLPMVRLDLFVAYAMTGLFAIAIMLISAGVEPDVMQGSQMVLSVAEHLGGVVGDTGKWLFLSGFWAAVFSSMLGVWQGIPYLFCDFVQGVKAQDSARSMSEDPLYRGYLLAMAIVPMSLLAFGKPVWLVMLYAVVGAMFMPLLAGLLLYLNRSRWLGENANGVFSVVMLLVALSLFAMLFINKTVTLMP